MNWFKKSQLIKVSKTLYHGTIIDNLGSIRDLGLIGGDFENDDNFLNSMYGDSYGPEIWEELSQDKEIPAFLTDKTDLNKAITAMKFQIGKKLNKSFHEVKAVDILNHGLLVVVKDPEDSIDQYPHEGEDYDAQERYLGLEPGDYYSEGEKADVLLIGNKLINYLNKMNYNFVPTDKWRNKIKGQERAREIGQYREDLNNYPLFKDQIEEDFNSPTEEN